MKEGNKRYRIIIACVIIILFIACAIGYSKYNSMKDPYKAFEKELQQQEESVEKKVTRKENIGNNNVDERDINSDLKRPTFENSIINILLLGVDSDDERESERMGYRSDTIMITSINLDTGKVNILSIPRDSYTAIPGKKSKDKINHAMSYGGGPKKEGSQYAIEAVEGLLGINIHYFVTMNMDAVKSIVDTIGGVTIDVERKMGSGNNILEKGEQKLNGEQALVYIRDRNTAKGDLARIEQQQKFMLALFKQIKESGKLSDVLSLYIKVQDKIFTNLEIEQIGALALLLKDIDLDVIQSFILTGKDIRINGIYYLEIDEEYMKSIINEHFLYNNRNVQQDKQISQCYD